MTLDDFTNILIEVYSIGMLSEPEQKKYKLIQRYYEHVSERLKSESTNMRKEGQRKYQKLMEEYSRKDNPLLKKIKPDSNSSGAYVPIPIIYNGKDDT